MKCSYRRDGRQSYMILEGLPEEVGYEKRMLQENEVHGLIPFSSVCQNDQVQIWYDITGRKSLRDYMEQEQPLTLPFLKRLLNQLSALDGECSRYLLNTSHICMNPDTIYIKGRNESFTVQLCYCPLEMNSHDNGLLAVMEYLISLVDHSNEELCRICYDLYDTASENSCSMQMLCAIVDRDKEQDPETGLLISEENDWPGNQRHLGEEYQNAFQDKNDYFKGDLLKKPLKKPLKKAERKDGALSDTVSTEKVTGEQSSKNLFVRIFQKMEDLFRKVLHREGKKVKEKKQQLFPDRQDNKPVLVFDLDEEAEEEGTMLLIASPDQTDAFAETEIRGVLRYEGTENFDDIILNQPVITVGSAIDNTVVLNEPSISRHHARIYRRNDGVFLEDLNSLNGTRIEEEYLAAHEKRKLEAGRRIFFAAEPFLVV